MNYSGSTSRQTVEVKEIAVVNKEYTKPEEETEIERIMAIFEKTRIDTPQLFTEIMQLNKKIIEIISKEKVDHSELKELDKMFNYLDEINDDYLFWCVTKGVKISILETKNLDIVHFFLVKKRYPLSNTVFKNIVIEYIRSLSNINFLECNSEDMNKYVTILEWMLQYGHADINQKEDNTLHTPLHLAVVFKQYQFLLILLKNNCLINPMNTYDESPLDIAKESIKAGEDIEIYEVIVELLSAFEQQEKN